MNKCNYQKELEKIIEEEGRRGHTPSLLLHSCCAPCSSYVLEYLSRYFMITDVYYNPNIEPIAEYEKRADELERLIGQMELMNPVRFIRAPYEPEVFHDAVRGMEEIPEGGSRCFVCYELRLRDAARRAAEGNYDYFTTTLSISPLKNAQKLNEIGERLAQEFKVRYLPSDFKKKNGYQRSVELSKKYDLYRQNYCGCVYSKRMGSERDLDSRTPLTGAYASTEKRGLRTAAN